MNSGTSVAPYPSGTLTIGALREAVARAEGRVAADLPGDRERARRTLQMYRTRLAAMELVRCPVCQARHGRERCPWCQRETAG